MSELNEIKGLIEKQAKVYQDHLDTMKKEASTTAEQLNAFTTKNAEWQEKVDKQLAEYENLKERADELHAERERGKLAGDVETLNKAEVEQFMNYARLGDKAFMNATAMEVRSNPDGGYTVPEVLSARIIASSEGNNPMAMLANRETINSGNSLDVLADPDELGYSESAEGGVASGSTTPEIFKTNIPLVKIDSEPKATIELLMDSAWDIESYLERKAARIFRKRLNTQFTTGTGVNQARGIATYTAVADATFAADVTSYWGSSVGYIASGSAAAIPNADCLIDMVGSVEDMYLPNASWQMKRATLNTLKKIKATGTTADDQLYSLWTPSLVAGQPDLLLGYPVYKNDAVAAVAANAIAAVFGDIQEAYTIVDKVGGMYMVRDPYTSKAYVKFYFARRVGGGVVNFEAIKYLKVASS